MCGPYLAVVALTMFVAPLVSMGWAYAVVSLDLLRLTGMYFVLWSVEVRLTLAGRRQYLRHPFTVAAPWISKGAKRS